MVTVAGISHNWPAWAFLDSPTGIWLWHRLPCCNSWKSKRATRALLIHPKESVTTAIRAVCSSFKSCNKPKTHSHTTAGPHPCFWSLAVFSASMRRTYRFHNSPVDVSCMISNTVYMVFDISYKVFDVIHLRMQQIPATPAMIISH